MTLELESLTFDVNGTKTVVLAAGDPDAPPLVFFHGAGTFHGWQFAEPWTEHTACWCRSIPVSASPAISMSCARCTTSCCTTPTCSTSSA